jgi:magnesium transporter
MKKFEIGKKHKHKAGLSPGTLIFSGERRVDAVSIHLISFTAATLEEQDLTPDEFAGISLAPDTTHWINVMGIHDADAIKLIGERFHLHPLVLEDIMNTRQRPKMESYEDYIYVVAKLMDFLPERRQVIEEQMSIVIQDRLVLTFLEEECEIFDQVRQRLRAGKGKMRTRNSDYLAYALLDAIVDEYFFILEALGEEIDHLEESLLNTPNGAPLKHMQALKRQMIGIRRHIWPIREVVAGLSRLDSELIKPETAIFLRDVHDHTMQIAETIEAQRDILGGIQDLHLSVVNNKMNEVMKVLAGISTIFMPMTLVAGIYGMNFKFMPELEQTWGYPMALGVMGLIGVGVWAFFRARKWL